MVISRHDVARMGSVLLFPGGAPAVLAEVLGFAEADLLDIGHGTFTDETREVTVDHDLTRGWWGVSVMADHEPMDPMARQCCPCQW
jgi:hypothetical protein